MNPASPLAEARPRPGKGWPVRACVAIAACWILAPFLSASSWACILAHVTLPMHSRLMRMMPTLPKTGAVLSTAAVAVAGIGGITAFGLVGVVIGPVVLSVCWSMAREAWRSPEVDSDGAVDSVAD